MTLSLLDQVLEMSRQGLKRHEMAKALGVHERKIKEMRMRLVAEGRLPRMTGGNGARPDSNRDDYELRCVDSRGRDRLLESLKKAYGDGEKV